MNAIIAASERAYPKECCGLLVGRRLPTGNLLATDVVAAPNVANRLKKSAFEVDPRVRFRISHALEKSAEQLIGHYHSHPDGVAAPSLRDLETAFEPDLLWIIVAVKSGQAVSVSAHSLSIAEKRFHRQDLRIAREKDLCDVGFFLDQGRITRRQSYHA